jgi:hypothetical protein
LPTLAKPPACPLKERAFVGSWSTPAGDEIVRGDVHEIAFEYIEGKRVYSEWLHHRPMGSGTWRVQGCEAVVTDQGASWRYRFLNNDGRRLVHVPFKRGNPIYRRIT